MSPWRTDSSSGKYPQDSCNPHLITPYYLLLLQEPASGFLKNWIVNDQFLIFSNLYSLLTVASVQVSRFKIFTPFCNLKIMILFTSTVFNLGI